MSAAVMACADAAATPDELRVEQVWARSTPAVVATGAVYLTMSSPIDDQLQTASVDPAVADRVSFHETRSTPGGARNTSGDDGIVDDAATMAHDMTSMGELAEIELPAGEQVVLTPGDRHLMLEQLTRPLLDGASFEMTLEFEQAGRQTVTVEVRDNAP